MTLKKYALCAFIALVFFAPLALLDAPEPDPVPAEVAYVVAPYCVVRTWNGEIGIFFGGEDTPTLVLAVRVASLPLADQERLAAGISIASAADLSRLIEDYDS